MTDNQTQLSVIEALSALDTSCASDALDRLGVKGGLEGIKPLMSGMALCGTAYTVRYKPCGVEKGTVGDFLDDVAQGHIVVIDNQGRTDCTVWGDLMSLTACKREVGGTVINGICRDVKGIRELKYPVFSRGHFMVTGKDRVELDAINVTVTISGVEIRSGDFLLGDDTGVIVIPQERILEVLDIAKEIAQKEEAMAQAIRNGMPLREVRAQVGYHALQTRQRGT